MTRTQNLYAAQTKRLSSVHSIGVGSALLLIVSTKITAEKLGQT